MLPFMITWLDFKDITLRYLYLRRVLMPRVLLDISPCEIILVEKDKYFMISLIYGFLKKKKKTREQNKTKTN